MPNTVDYRTVKMRSLSDGYILYVADHHEAHIKSTVAVDTRKCR